ncbi:STAS domain-containing protein [Cryptosporangium aurantiacum]|uniref:Anti-anti-sigma factor n=1 Tax=Cryptosporangium aurantiacum TaxID=134849 RepID=A0A1M7GZR9_9ACTN|nr:STAS domain-containing protein [Cryptosporangium aurantiacum]SHM21882.1 anti-anti-sigma factor [Cryptosporangium aurantiacum]
MKDEVRVDGERPEFVPHGDGPPPAAATVSVQNQGDADREAFALVTFVGEIDLGTAPALGDTVLRGTTEATAVVLDLSAVTFLDSAGVRLLDNLVHAYEGRGCVVRLVAPEHGVARFTLTLCAFRSDLVETTVSAARDSLN